MKKKITNCKIFTTGGRFLKELPQKNLPITVIGINEEGEVYYREGAYFWKREIFQTDIIEAGRIVTEEYIISSLAQISDYQFQIREEQKFNFYSAISDEIDEAFLYWERLIHYKEMHPEKEDILVRIKGRSFEIGNPFVTAYIKLNQITESGFYYERLEKFYRIWPAKSPEYSPFFVPED